MTNEKLGTSGPIKIELGAGNPAEGESRTDGWLYQDIDGSIPGIDIVCNILDIDKHVLPNSVDEYKISHVLEHFTKIDVPRVLKKLFKTLKTDGKLTIIVPNFRWHAELCLNGNEEQAIYYCFGGQKDEWDLHKTGFTRNILKNVVQDAGFALVSCDDESSITCVATKP